MIRSINVNKPNLSWLFWVAFSVTYAVCILGVYGIIMIPEDAFDLKNNMEMLTAFKLATVRLAVATFLLIGYPVLLWTSIKWSKYFMICGTAWAIAMLIDDYLVLYKIIEYPERGTMALFQTVRPAQILSLIWMSFELTFKPAHKQ